MENLKKTPFKTGIIFRIKVLTKHNMNISEAKTKAMAMNGKSIPRVKIVINNKIIEQVTEFIYLGSHLSQYNNQKDIDKFNKLQQTDWNSEKKFWQTNEKRNSA